MALAIKTSLESPDTYKKVGCVGVNDNGHVAAFGYNSILDAKPEKMGYKDLDEFMNNRDVRRPFMVHAESMMCSLVTKGQINEVYTSLFPCVDCMKNLAVHGVKRVVYGEAYEKDKPAFAVARFYGIDVFKLVIDDLVPSNGEEKVQ
jgi:dCMP deaminase